jgi:hypothetical protein
MVIWTFREVKSSAAHCINGILGRRMNGVGEFDIWRFFGIDCAM